MKLFVVAFVVFALTSTIDAANDKPQCKANEEYIVCGPICPATCAARDPNLNCKSRECIKGCFCKAGFSRTPSGDCVKHGECSLATTTSTTTAKPK